MTERAIDEIVVTHQQDLPEGLLTSDAPWVARGFVENWPIVQAAENSLEESLRGLLSFYQQKPVSTIIAEPEHRGRFFYDDSLSGFNFLSLETSLPQVIEQLLTNRHTAEPPGIYVGSTDVDQWLPGFTRANPLGSVLPNLTTSLWLGNRSRISAHFDFPRNIACCIFGRRRFTLAPPEQIENLYIGPLDFTPAGQPISMVDFNNPDYARFPRFAEAEKALLTVELEPGDAVYIPSLWWHHVEGLDPINGLINYWWHELSPVNGSPIDALKHALMSVRCLPKAQRDAMKNFFNHYIFADDDEHLAHMPEAIAASFDSNNQDIAQRLRNHLQRTLTH
ncbi:MAG: cupin [Halieaceae bacterium MED-G27]|jgi:hypothetical protein|nr:MAG: cupin [Halieaceae bacterium MED-G27]|tara:strand:- start:6246 stop:7253 length:1008 start_codon:yes stop_codon:yes gene_type:complete